MRIVALFRRMLLAIAICSAGSFGAGAQAQTVPNPSPSSNAVALAKELISLKGGVQMFEGVVSGVIESAKNAFLPTNPQLGKPLNDATAVLQKEFESKKAEIVNEVARAYARHFTEQELKELLAFYKTALGKKVLLEEPAAVEDAFKRASDWSNTFSEEVIGRLRVEMKKKGYDL
jgi:hypothetical protein